MFVIVVFAVFMVMLKLFSTEVTCCFIIGFEMNHSGMLILYDIGNSDSLMQLTVTSDIKIT